MNNSSFDVFQTYVVFQCFLDWIKAALCNMDFVIMGEHPVPLNRISDLRDGQKVHFILASLKLTFTFSVMVKRKQYTALTDSTAWKQLQ